MNPIPSDPHADDEVEPLLPRDAIRVTDRSEPYDRGFRLEGFGLRVRADRTPMPVVRVDAAAFYRDPAFRAWLEHERFAPATWHVRGQAPGEWSDTFVFFGGAEWDAEGRFSGEGNHYPSDAEHPGFSAEQYALLARAVELVTGSARTECLVWLTNLNDGEDDQEDRA
jgi:hypothetical protein